MDFRIKALQGYFGGKGASGVHQKIINLIPPHHTFVVPFLGHCAITRSLRPCNNWYLNDIDPRVVASWQKFQRKNPEHFATNTTVLNWSWHKMLPSAMDHPEVVMYLDPPYPEETLKGNHRFKFRMENDGHVELLEKIGKFNNANILLSTYDNALYEFYLKNWNKISFEAQTQSGKSAIETLYFNFEPPTRLHDYRYFGDNHRSRERYKDKRKNLVDKFERMTALERNYFMDALTDPTTGKTTRLENH